jgi:hypothetical protein
MMKWRAIPRFCDKNRGRFYGFIFRIVMALTAMGRLAVIKIASVFGNTFAPKTDLNSALAKWRTILSILLTQSAPS